MMGMGQKAEMGCPKSEIRSPRSGRRLLQHLWTAIVACGLLPAQGYTVQMKAAVLVYDHRARSITGTGAPTLTAEGSSVAARRIVLGLNQAGDCVTRLQASGTVRLALSRPMGKVAGQCEAAALLPAEGKAVLQGAAKVKWEGVSADLRSADLRAGRITIGSKDSVLLAEAAGGEKPKALLATKVRKTYDISADKLELEPKTRTYEAVGNAHLSTQDLDVTSERITLVLEQGANKIKSMKATGGVTVHYEYEEKDGSGKTKLVATGDQAELLADQNKAVVMGHAKVNLYGSGGKLDSGEIVSDRVMIDMTGGKTKVTFTNDAGGQPKATITIVEEQPETPPQQEKGK